MRGAEALGDGLKAAFSFKSRCMGSRSAHRNSRRPVHATGLP